jgi:hypothetical protein
MRIIICYRGEKHVFEGDAITALHNADKKVVEWQSA